MKRKAIQSVQAVCRSLALGLAVLWAYIFMVSFPWLVLADHDLELVRAYERAAIGAAIMLFVSLLICFQITLRYRTYIIAIITASEIIAIVMTIGLIFPRENSIKLTMARYPAYILVVCAFLLDIYLSWSYRRQTADAE